MRVREVMQDSDTQHDVPRFSLPRTEVSLLDYPRTRGTAGEVPPGGIDRSPQVYTPKRCRLKGGDVNEDTPITATELEDLLPGKISGLKGPNPVKDLRG